MSKSLTKRTTPPSAEKQIAEQFTEQYKKAISGTREVLIFGAMMMSLPRVLELQNSSPVKKEQGMGLKGWIEEHCPAINYKTAHSFYALAKSMREALGIKDSTDVHKLLTAPANSLSKKDAKIRKEIDGTIEGKSMRQLEFDFGIRKPKGRSGAPEGNQNASKKLTDAETTKMVIDSEIGSALQNISKRIDNRSVAMIGLSGVQTLKTELEHLIDKLKPIITELANKSLEK